MKQSKDVPICVKHAKHCIVSTGSYVNMQMHREDCGKICNQEIIMLASGRKGA